MIPASPILGDDVYEPVDGVVRSSTLAQRPSGAADLGLDRARRRTVRPSPRPHVVVAARLFRPEPAAAAYRLGSMVRVLARRGVDVTVLTTRPPRPVRGEVWGEPSVRVKRWPVLRDAGGNVRGYVQFASFDIPLLWRLLTCRRPDVVVAEPPPTTGAVVRLIAGARRIPYVYYAADVSSPAAAGMGVASAVVWLLRRVESWVMRGAVSVLAVSSGVVREVEALGVDPERVRLVGTGVDTELFCPGELPPHEDATLVYAGTMSEVHGAEVFVRAFARVAGEMPQARLIMLGQGTERQELEELAERLVPGRVDFEGLVGSAQVTWALRGARAGLASVRPGRGYDFAFPTKMFVSTACGTPVIYSGVGPGSAMVEKQALGWAVDWDVDQVADAMMAALSEPPSPTRRASLVTWTADHASQSRVAEVAAGEVLEAGRHVLVD